MQTATIDLTALADQLADNMTEHAIDHWKDYIERDIFGEQYIRVDQGDALDSAYTRIYGEDIDDALFNDLMKHPRIKKAAEDMEDAIKEESRYEMTYMKFAY